MPYLLLAVLVLGTGLGIGLGLSEAPTTSTHAVIPPCHGSSLSVHGGREGGGLLNAAGVVSLTNTSSAPCTLSGTPVIAVLNDASVRLKVQDRPPQSSITPLVVGPGRTGSIAVFWVNWCGSAPGPLQVEVSLPHAGGKVTGPWNDPSYVPGCKWPTQDSYFVIVSAYYNRKTAEVSPLRI